MPIKFENVGIAVLICPGGELADVPQLPTRAEAAGWIRGQWGDAAEVVASGLRMVQ